jgi:hypothetical protein
MAIDAYSINGHCGYFINDYCGYFINGYWCLFYQWLLMLILLMAIGACFINDY